jgi:hypothetical protein
MIKTTISYITTWKFWAIVLTTIMFVIYIFHGGQRDHQIVGIGPLREALGDGRGGLSSTYTNDYWLEDILKGKSPPQPVQYSTFGNQGVSSVDSAESLELQPPTYEDSTVYDSVNTYTNQHMQIGQISNIQEEVVNQQPVEDNQSIFRIQPRTSEIPHLQTYKSKGEEMTCKALGMIMGSNVKVGVRNLGIVNPKTGRQLEIDCMVGNIGVEYNGEQHYVYPNKFHKTEEEFYKQVERDQFKNQRAPELGVYLINIPYTVDTCKMTARGPVKTKYTASERYTRIYDYLYHVINLASEGLEITPHYTTHYYGY